MSMSSFDLGAILNLVCMLPETRAQVMDALKDPTWFAESIASIFSSVHGIDLAQMSDANKLFFEIALPHLYSVERLSSVLAVLPEEYGAKFMEFLALHPATPLLIVSTIVSDPVVFERLPKGSGWVGHALWRRGAALLNAEPGKKFEIEDLLPLGLIDGSARSLLGTALDEDALTDAAKEQLRLMYPNDRYIQFRLGPAGAQAGNGSDTGNHDSSGPRHIRTTPLPQGK